MNLCVVVMMIYIMLEYVDNIVVSVAVGVSSSVSIDGVFHRV